MVYDGKDIGDGFVVIGQTALALAMIAAFVLGVFGTRLAVRNVGAGDRRQGVLMVVAAAVLVGNVLVWTV